MKTTPNWRSSIEQRGCLRKGVSRTVIAYGSRIPLLTNAALASVKCNPPSGSLAVSLCSRVLGLGDLAPAEKGKALYRRALGKSLLKDDEGAEEDLRKALEVVPGDAGIIKSLKDVEGRLKARKEKERKAYAKMFA